MISINKSIKSSDFPVELFAPNGESLGVFDNEIQWLDVRLQIVQQRADGYYVMYNGQRIDMDTNGNLSDFPVGILGEKSRRYLLEIISAYNNR